MHNSSETKTDFFLRFTPKFLTESGLTVCSHHSSNIYLENENMLREILQRIRHGSSRGLPNYLGKIHYTP